MQLKGLASVVFEPGAVGGSGSGAAGALRVAGLTEAGAGAPDCLCRLTRRHAAAPVETEVLADEALLRTLAPAAFRAQL